MDKITVMVVDDHSVFRLGISAMIQSDLKERFELIGHAADGDAAVTEVVRLKPKVVLMDFQLPGLDGASATKTILRRTGGVTKVLAITADTDERSVIRMVKAGASGFIPKTTEVHQILQAVEFIASGKSYFSEEASAALASAYMVEKDNSVTQSTNVELLSKRELEILKLVSEEKTNQEISKMLFISTRTVETHKRNILMKLKIKNVAGLVKYYFLHVNE
jgi:DNA-binding NarL/FixJ family response regulator